MNEPELSEKQKRAQENGAPPVVIARIGQFEKALKERDEEIEHLEAKYAGLLRDSDSDKAALKRALKTIDELNQAAIDEEFGQ